jgi:lipoteichoic acid synthase
MAGSSPRVLVSAEEVAVPVTLTNAGLESWDPASVHLSYHWLWFVPRELAARSRWDLPYHDGIRTDLAAAVGPGAATPVQARILAPDWPGLYWLQWDMVEEGVAWFAQAAPRQARTLVVVLPPLVWVLAPIPFLIAVAGVVAAGRRTEKLSTTEDTEERRSGFFLSGPRVLRGGEFLATADAAWCASALALKPLIVVHDALLEPTAVAYWLIAVAALAPPALGLVLLPRRLRVWTLIGIGMFGSLLVLADVVYYRFFGDVLSTPALLAAGQTSHVWGSIRSLFSPLLVWTVIDCPIALWLGVRLTRLETRRAPLPQRAAAAGVLAAGLGALGIALSAPRALAAAPLGQMFRDRSIVEQIGLFGFHAYDAWVYVRSTWFRPAVTDAELNDALAWFVDRAPLRRGRAAPSFAVASGLNLVVVQVESLQDYMVDFRVGGPGGDEVMPHLRRWVDDSIRFTNVTDQTNEGRTSDAEFTTMSSLLPLEHGAVAFRYPGNHYVALPSILSDRGYATLSAVAFEPGFWNRRVMHPAYGFAQSLFEPDFQLTEQIGWGLNDRDFLQQMMPRLTQLRQPFAAWLITLSLHHPFDDFPARHKVLKVGSLEGTPFGNYLHTMRFFDDALEAFKSSLASSGLLDRTVLVVFGDHDAGFARSAGLARTIGIRPGEAAWTLSDRVPLFVRVPHGPGVAGVNPVAAGQTDLAPTILSLLGIDAAALPYVGRNLLGEPGDGPVPRPHGDWIDGRHLYLQGGGGVCHDAVSLAPVPDACADAEQRARREREVSRLVVTADLQARFRDVMRHAQIETR